MFAPIYREGADTAAVGLGVRNSLFLTDAILPTSGRPFPDTLWDIEAGLAYAHQWDNGWTTGCRSSAPGRPATSRSPRATCSSPAWPCTTPFPAEEQDAWVLGVSYSPTSDFPYPLPIVSYYWRPSDDLQVDSGCRSSLRWQFLPQLDGRGPVGSRSARCRPG